MNKKELIIDILEGLNSDELLSIYREYQIKTDDFDNEIYTLDDLNMIAERQDTYGLLCCAFYGDFDPTANYFTLDKYGNIQSIFTYDLEKYVDIDDIAEFCINNNESLYNDEIQEVLNSEETEVK